MRQLRLLTLADDGSHLVVETDDGDERFALQVDLALRAAVVTRSPQDVRARPVPAGVPDARSDAGPAAIGPRDIQVRVRGGESPQQLADTYGMSLERIMRFAAPVLEERARISGEARRARARRNTTDGQLVVFGEAVDERFTAHGIRADSVNWDAHRREDGEWVVLAQWAGGTGTPRAEWLFSRSSRSVTPLDEAAVDLLSDRPIRPVVRAGSLAAERASLAAAPPLRPGVVAFPPMPDAHTGPLPRIEEVFDQEAPPEGPRAMPRDVPRDVPREAPSFVPAAEVPAPPSIRFSTAEIDFEEPPLPLGITDPSTRPGGSPGVGALRTLGTRRTETEEDRAARAKVPSWDDILLGVRRKSD